MPSFSDTVEIERAFLKHLTSGGMMARLYMHRVSEDMFTSNERKFIYLVAFETLKNSKSVLTRTIFEYEVGAKVAETDSAYYLAEWNLVDGLKVVEHPDALLVKLVQAKIGRKTLSVTEEVVGLLQAGSIEEAVAHLKREAMGLSSMKESRPTVELTDYERRLQSIRDKKLHPEKYLGIKIGFPTFDRHTGGLFSGELTLMAGITGIGKSTICKQICQNIAILNNGKNVLHIANEEYLEQVEHKYDAIYTKVPYLDFKLARISDEEIERWKTMMLHNKNTDVGRIFIKEVPAFTDVSLIEQAYRELENKGIHIHVIMIDHLPHIVPIEKAWGENDERGKAAADCKELARWLRVPVIVPTQAATEVEDKQTKGRRAGKLDVYGSKAQIHIANTFFIITDKGKDETQVGVDEWNKDVFWLVDVKKNRDGPPFHFRAKHSVRYGGVEEVPDVQRRTAATGVAEDEKETKKSKTVMKAKGKPENKTTNEGNEVKEGTVVTDVPLAVAGTVDAVLREEAKVKASENMGKLREEVRRKEDVIEAEVVVRKGKMGAAIAAAAAAAKKGNQ
jgi:replicative DNA helicase